MWSPKRIILLAASFVLLLMGYMAYGFSSVGRIDGLPPLPAALLADGDGGGWADPPERGESELERRLKLAFGADCKELGRPIRLDIPARGMVLAAEDFRAQEDGRVLLTVMSIAVFSSDPKTPEISTIQANVAFVKLDRPVTNFAEMGARKIVALELCNSIEIRNNRKRVERDQDLAINIPVGPLYYDEPTRKVWTNDHVHVVDRKAGPKPHVVDGRGMEMELLVDQGRDGKGRETVSGVKWLELKSNVSMELHSAGQDGFFDASAGQLGGAKPKTPATAPPPKRSEIRIGTPGKFRFKTHKGFDLAIFDAPPRGVAAGQPGQVHVDRETDPANGHDQLVCTRLVLRLKKSETAPPGTAPAPATPVKKEEGGSRIETMHATGPEREVVITSESERLEAYCADFFHDADKGITVLKGRIGMSVRRGDNEIHARDLTLTRRPAPPPVKGQPPAKESHDAKSQGPGTLALKENKDGKPMKAAWTNTLTMTRDGAEDLITLVGDARFDDPNTDQSMSADILKVWLDPEEKKSTPAPAAVKGDSSSGRKARHLEATGSVVVRSKELSVHDTSRLVAWFRDVPAPPPTLPKEAPKAGTGSAAPKAGGMPPLAPVPATPAKPEAPPAPPRPYDISARSIEAKILRAPAKNTIDVLTCEGAVAVRQDPAKPGEKGTDVRGETLRMTAAPENCHVLVVTGDLAEVKTDKIEIYGPEVTIDQFANKTWVVGDGAMQMDSATNFQGDKLATPQPLAVSWKKSMLFDGWMATFRGGIQATQGQARMLSERMDVHFDKLISLREGNRTDQSAKVRYMVADQDVGIHEKTLDKAGKFEKYQRLQGPFLVMNTLEADELAKGATKSKIDAKGPGVFLIIDRGDEGPLDAPAPGGAKPVPRPGAPKEKGKAKPEAGLRLTHVRFDQTMTANSLKNVVTFYKNVRVLHLPVAAYTKETDPDKVIAVEVNPEKVLAAELDENGMYMQCDILQVLDRPTDGKPSKRMHGRGNVRVLGRDFSGNADQVHYDQSKDQIVFIGGDSGPAELKQVEVPGAKPRTVTGRTITYERATRHITVGGGVGGSGSGSK